MTTDPNKLLLDVTALAREAGRAILEVYASSFKVQEKADSSPLTEADLRSEKLILAGLRRIAPEIPVLSEETGQSAWATRRNWSRLWVVDPLDGTKEFVQRNGEFTVNIALVDNHRPVLGIVHAPVGKTSFAQDALIANAQALVDSIVKAKPPAAKGRYLKSITVSSTMGPGVRIDTTSVEAVKH